jgi:hypothetical protein
MMGECLLLYIIGSVHVVRFSFTGLCTTTIVVRVVIMLVCSSLSRHDCKSSDPKPVPAPASVLRTTNTTNQEFVASWPGQEMHDGPRDGFLP